jgi:outer membrane protein
MRRRLRYVATVAWMVASLVISPAYGQQAQEQTQGQAPPVPPVGDPARNLKLSLGPDYSNGPSWFPRFTLPYQQRRIPEPVLANSPRVDQLIQNGKLMLSLEDAISLSLENNLAIAVERYVPWLEESSLLLAKAGASPGSRLGFDPVLTGALNLEEIQTPINNPITSGVGLTPGVSNPTETVPPALVNHFFNANFNYVQNFHEGTQVQVSFNSFRESSSLTTFSLNPFVESTMTAIVTQPLLNGFGRTINDRYIIEGRNNVKVGSSQFAQQVITTVTQTANDYWELVYARENVKVEQTAVAADQQLYENNKKQLEIGTMAPLDVITAESQLASDQQALVQAQTTQLQDETTLLVAITEDPLAMTLSGVEIVPTTPIVTPDVVETIPLQDAVHEAWQKRPELQQAQLTLENAGVEVKATKNALLPTVNLFGEFQEIGIGGNETFRTSTPTGAFATSLSSPIFLNGGVTEPIGAVPVGFVGSAVTTPVTTVFPGGIGDDFSRLFNGKYPTLEAGINLTLPIRNRAAQAQNTTALLTQQQERVQYLQTQSTIVLNVRQTLIALIQDRSAVVSAGQARTLAQQSYDDEVKKLNLGTSTAFNVVLKQQQLTAAQGVELRDRINLIEAEVNFNQAMGRTLDVHHITVADARSGNVSRIPNIPGTPDTEAAQGR